MGFYSDFLIEQLDGFDEFIDETDPENNVTPEDRALEREIQSLCRALLQGKEDWFRPEHASMQAKMRILEKAPEQFTIFFERIIVRWLLQQADRIVARFLESPAISLAKQPPGDVRTYVVEATRCYTLGLFHASTILSRAALHTALLARLDAKGVRVIPARRDEFAHVIALCREKGVLLGDDSSRADRIRDAGGRAAHGQTVTQGLARSTLVGLRWLLARLYA